MEERFYRTTGRPIANQQRKTNAIKLERD